MKSHPPEYGSQEVFYRDHYQASRGVLSRGVFSILWRYPHKVMEKGKDSNVKKVIVELGVGFGEHFEFINRPWQKYYALDLILRDTLKSRAEKYEGIELIQGDAHQTGLPDSCADRVIATCLIAHLEKPEKALREWHRICKNAGTMSIYVPCESGLVLKIFRNLVSARKAKKQGFSGYKLFILREHVNSYSLIDGFIRENFYTHQIKVRRRPFPFLGWYFNLFSIYEIRVEK